MTSFGEQHMNSKARIVNIQRYSLNDGLGIRTIVFFKGCPLKCPWCSNPESRSMQIEQSIAPRLNSNNVALSMKGIKKENILTQYGWDVSLDELLDEVLKDDVFFRASGGGITLSGGEVLTQADFAIAFLKKLKEVGLHTAIETTGHGKKSDFEKICQYCDEILFDFKIMDKKQATKILSANMDLILSNFETALQKNMNIIARIPLIPNYTLNDDNIEAICQYLLEMKDKYKQLSEVHLLPFHQYGLSKYESLGFDYQLKNIQPPSEEVVDLIKQKFEKIGFNVIIGG